MKKVMIGILILIPIIILFVVALVSSFLEMHAWISVEDMKLYYAGTQTGADSLSLSLTDSEYDKFSQYIDVRVLPENANRYVVKWQIVGDIRYTDSEYESLYNQYLDDVDEFNGDFNVSYSGFETDDGIKTGKYVSEIEEIFRGKPYKPFELTSDEEKAALKAEIREDLKKIVLKEVKPAVMLVDADGNEVDTNTDGKFLLSSYCSFTVRVEAEHVSKTLSVSVVGDTVEKVVIIDVDEDAPTQLVVGQSKRVAPVYTPIDSIVNKTEWRSNNEAVAVVDQNGVITAKGVGSAEIFVKALKHSSENGIEEYVENEEAYTVTVSAGASVKYGNAVVTAKTSLTFDELGITEASAIEGCEVDDARKLINITAPQARLLSQNGELQIALCEEGDIIIENAKAFDHNESNFVFAVSKLTLKLNAVFADMTVGQRPQNVVWESSNESVATVSDNGEVTALSNGIVVIRAIVGAKVAEVELNVQYKLASIQLVTSNESLKVGVARETVFASDRYVDVGVSNAKTANSIYIRVLGEPKDATATELKNFYSAFTFEIVEGNDYASFDANEINKLVFNGNLEGKGKQTIKVKVSAKYPRYDGMTRDTVQEVAINAVYGVQVSDIAELRQAAIDQEEYVHREDLLKPAQEFFRHTVEGKGYEVVSYNGRYSTQGYAAVLVQNCAYEHDEEGNPITIGGNERVRFYSDLYGNNHMISAENRQCTDKLIQIAWSNVTISNVILRANNLGDNAVITDGNDTKDFLAECMIIERIVRNSDGTDNERNDIVKRERLNNIVLEYSIFENGTKAAAIYGADVTFNGCIIRNMSQAGFWSPANMYDSKTEENVKYPRIAHITTNNIVVSNTLGTLASIQTNGFAKTGDGEYMFADNKEDNEAYFMEHFYPYGINHEYKQTGFLDVYNWTDINQAAILQTGNSDQDKMIAQFTGPLVLNNSAFESFRIMREEQTFIHIAFILVGTGGGGLVNEPIYTKVELADERLYSLYSRDIPKENSGVAGVGESMLKNMELYLFGYKNTADIQPETKYTVDSALISHLHGEK